jgi:hypothetical protein
MCVIAKRSLLMQGFD